MKTPDVCSIRDRSSAVQNFLDKIKQIMQSLITGGVVCSKSSGVLSFHPHYKNRAFIKVVSFILVIIFSTTQITWGQEYLSVATQGPQAVKNIQEDPETIAPVKSQTQIQQTAHDFLQDTLSLSPATEEPQSSKDVIESREQKSEIKKEIEETHPDIQNYEYERYTFEDALDLLRPEYATAVILKDLKAGDLKQLLELDFETGIIVLHGEIVLITSGSEDEVGVLPAVKALTDKATFISHTHPNIYSIEGPSGQDINEAVVVPGQEYVSTHKGSYAYNNEGVLNDGNPYSYDWYIEKIQEAVEASKNERNQVEARKELNQYIVEQDRYNQASEDERITLRRGGTLSFTAGLTTANVTTLPGSPRPYITTGSTAATTLSASSNQFLMGYNVPGTADISGFTISFDNASTTTVEVQNITTQTYLTFGLKGPNTSVKLEIVDINGNKDTWTLTNISNTTEQFWRLPVSSIANTIDKTRIKQLNFIVAQANTTSTTRTGTFYVRQNGLNVNVPTQPIVTSAVPAATNQTTLTLSGTKEANTGILINGVQVVARDSATTWSTTINLTVDGNNTFSITAKDTIGKVSTAKSITVLRDRVVPTGSININSGALYAGSTTVTLNLSAADDRSGIDKMSFSTNNSTWTTPEAYTTSKSFSFPTGEGSKIVYVRYYDKVGNVSTTYSKSIILDTLAPTGTIKVNNGVQFINQTAVTLNLSATDAGSGIDKMSFSINNSTWTTAEAYSATKAWTFAAGDGNKTIYVKFLDKSGKWSSVVSSTVLLDTVKPTGSININSGAAYSNSQTVTLNLSATDAGAGLDKMSFSTDNVNWSTVETYATSKSYSLPAGDGNKTVYVRFYDKAGNISLVSSKSIILDTTLPAATMTLAGGSLFTNTRNITATLTSSDSGSGLDLVRFSVDGGQTWGVWEAYATSKALTLPAGDGNKSVQYQVRDKAGNVRLVTTNIGLDMTPLVGSMKINADAVATNQTQVTLNLTASDNFSGIGQMRFTTDTVNWIWTAWENFQATKTLTLPTGDGLKQVFWQIWDRAWNLTSGSDSILLDTVVPAGNFTINNGAAYTNNTSVNLQISVTDTGSGLDKMSFAINSTDPTAFSAWENYSSTKTLTLPSFQGPNYVNIKIRDKAGNEIFLWKSIIVDTVVPAGSIVINNNATQTTSRDVALTLTGSDATAGIDQMRFSVDNGTTWSSWETFATSKNVTLPDGSGNKTVQYQVKDKAGNVSAVYSKSITLTLGPTVQFTSAASVAAADYVLRYTVNGTAYQENWHLAPGANNLVIETTSGGLPYFFTYQVNYSGTNPTLLTTLLQQEYSKGFNLDLTKLLTASGQKLSDLVGYNTAELLAPSFDAQNKLTDAILRFEDGRAVQMVQGKLRQVLEPSGTLQIYASTGELEAIINPDDSRSNIAVRLDNFTARALTASTASWGSNVVFYDSLSRIRYGINNNEKTVYDAGILKQVKTPAGATYDYQISSITGGFESRLIGTGGDTTVKATLLRYDANRVMTYAESSDGGKFEFQNGVLTKATTIAGGVTQYAYDNSPLKDFLGFHVTRAGFQRAYDEDGKLAQLVTSQGVIAQIENSSITKVDLGAGQYATDLRFDGNGNVIEVKVHNTDGSIGHYVNNVLVDMELPDHSVITMSGGKARFLKTADGRNYRYVYALDASGNETSQALRAELISYTSPADNTLNLSSTLLSDFVLESENPLDNFAGGTTPVGSSTFIPLLSTPTNIIRNLQLDAAGKMINAEILNNSGDQYFVVNGKLDRIITINGKVLNFEDDNIAPPAPAPTPLTTQETAFRNQMIEQSLQYFKSGQGIDAVSGLPFDAIKEDGTPLRITQPTSIGFYLQILGAVMDGSYVSSSMTKQDALTAAQKAVSSLLTMQTQIGWKGLLPFANIGSPFTRYGNDIGVGDNANLAQSLAAFIGSIENAKSTSGLNLTSLNSLISQSETFITNQSQGYSSFYDATAGLFRSSYNVSTATFSGFNDRLMNEFRTGIAFVITRFNLPQKAWDNLVAVTRNYQDQEFNNILNAVPFDGGAFQMFWPLFRATQELKPEMKAAAWNFLYSVADYAAQNDLPGFPSASYDPIAQDYRGKIGVPELAETRDALNDRTVSVYSLASAYSLAPQFVLSWLKEIQTKYPSIMGPYGFYDSMAMPAAGTIGSPVVGKRVYAIDQGSFLLGLINNGGTAFNKYLDTRGYRNNFDNLYDRLRLNIAPVEENLLTSPFGTDELLSVQPPHAPPTGFRLTDITNSLSGEVDFNYLLSPLGALSDVDAHYTVDGVDRSSDLLTYFEQTQNRDEINYLLNSQPTNLFNQPVEQGAVFTPGQGNSVETRIQDSEKGFVKAFDYTIVPNGQPVGYYAKFNNLDLSNVDFVTFSVRRDPGTNVPQSLEVKLEGLGEIFIVDSIPTNWTRVVLPLKKPNTNLSKVAILIHDQVSQTQSGRVYLGDISLFSLKNYTPTSWESAVGLTKTQIETLAANYLASGTPPPPVQARTTLTNITLTADGDISSAQVKAKNGALLYIQGGAVTKVVTPDGKTILYKNGNADTVTSGSGTSATFSYEKDFKGDIQQVLLAEAGIQRVYDTTGRLDRLIFKGLSGGLSEGILTSLRTRFESITDLVGDEFGHIKDATISLSDGRVLYVKNYKLVKTVLLSGTEISYDGDGYVTSTRSKEGFTEYIYQKDVSGKITRVDVRYVKDGQTINKNLVPFLQEDNRVEEAAILLETPLVNLSEIASNIGSFFTSGRGFVQESKVTDPIRNDVLKVNYSIPSNPLVMGVYFRFPTLDLSKYEIMNVALKGTSTGAMPSVTIELKGAGNDRITLNNITSNWQDTNVPIDNLNSSIYEVTMLINPTQLNTSGTLYLDDISFFNLREMNAQAWQDQLSFNQSDLEVFSNKITQAPFVDPMLYQVSVPSFQELRDFQNLPTVLNFDATGKVQQFTRGDGAQITVSGDLPVTARLSNGQVISYQLDNVNQRVTSATITDSQTQTTSTTQYSYDRARTVTLENGQNLQYYYEEDSDGNEVTVVKDPQTGEIKKFVNGRIQSSENSGLVTTYTFDSNGNLAGSNLSFQGKAALDLTGYERRGDKTFITDRSGITWIYDANGVLVQHRTSDGLLYQHTSSTDENGQIQRLIFLLQKTAEDGTNIYYENGEISKIVFANGVTFVNPKYDENHALSGATVVYEDGSAVEYVNQFAVKVTDLFGDVTTYQLPAGKISLESTTDGKVDFIRIERDGMTLRYNREGDLVNLITADDVLYQYVYEESNGTKTGRMKIYRRELSKVAGVSVPFPISADADSYGNIHVLINGQLVDSASNQVRVLAINPADGSVDSSASFNMSLTGMGKNVLDYVNAMPDGEYVLIIYPQTSNGYSTDSANFMSALEKIGGDRTKSYINSKPWMVLGQKGLLKGQAFDTFKTYSFNGGTIRLDTEKRDVYYLNASRQVISQSSYGFPSTLLDTSRHGNYIGEMAEVFGTISQGSNLYASAYFKNYNIKYPESGLYRLLGDFEDRVFIEKPASYLDSQLAGLLDLTKGFTEKAIYYDERYPVRGITLNNLRALKGYLVSKGFRVVNADQLKTWITEKGPDSIVLMAQDIAPDTIVDLASNGVQLPRQYVNRGGSFAWLYDIPFYEIGHANGTSQVWGGAGDNYGLRNIFGISLAYETTSSQAVSLYNSTPSVSLDPIVLNQPLKLNFNIRELDAWQAISAKFENNTPAAQTDIASLFDQNGVVLGVRKADGTQNVFQEGKLKSILDRKGVHLIDYFYNSAGELIDVDYLQARQELAKQIQNAELQVAQLKTKALMQIAINRSIGIQDIQNQVLAGRASLADSRSQIEAQRYVTQCSKCGCSECCEQVENPGYQQAMANVVQAERQLEEDAANALSSVDSEVANAYMQIDRDQDSSIASIRAKQAEVLRSVIQNEITPIMMQFYRLLLGRDPSSAEMKRWLDAAVADPNNRIDTVALKNELTNSPERAQRLAEVALIKSDIRAFLNSYVSATSDVRVSQAAGLGLLADEIVTLNADQVNKIMAFLDNQNLHFGYSAFLPLQTFLAQNNLNASTRTIAVKAILIDILTGSINPFLEGDLRLTLFALERTAKVLGATSKGAKLTFEDLKQIYANNPTVRLVVHIKGNHFVTLVGVSEDKVSYIESAMGGSQVPGINAIGEIVEVSKEQFLEMWLNPVVNQNPNQEMGVALLPNQIQVQPDRILDSNLSKLIQGAFCGWDDFLIAVIITAVISGTVQAITATSGNFVTNFLKGFAFGAITGAVTFGIGAVLGSFANAVTSIAGNVINGIKSFVQPIINGFRVIGSAVGKFVSNAFTNSVGHFLGGVANWIGKGISAVQSFSSNVMKVATDGFKSLKSYVQTATGVKKFVVQTLLAVAVDYSANKGLVAIGVNPKVAALASAFVTGGFLAAINTGGGSVTGVRKGIDGITLGESITVSNPLDFGASAIDGFVLGGVKSLTYKAIPSITQSFNFSSEVSNVLRIASSALIGAGGSVTNDILKGLGKDLASELALTGATTLGNRIGLSPSLASLVGVPIRSTLSGLIDALSNPNGGGGPGLFKEITKITFGGAVTVGAAIALDKIKAPEIVKGLGSVLVSGIISGLIPHQTFPGVQPGEPIQGAITTQTGILNGIQDAFEKALIDLFGNPRNNIIDFSTLAQQKGLKGALDAMIGLSLQRASLESLYQSTTNLADYALQKYQQAATITYNGRPAKEVKLQTGDKKITLVFDQATNNLVRLEESGRVLEGDIRFDQFGNLYINSGSELLVDGSGAARHTVYENGKIVLHQDMRDGEAFDYYAAPGRDLKFAQDGSLYEGIIENTSTGVRYIMREGKIVTAIQKVNYPTIEFGSGLFNQESSSLGEIRSAVNENGEIISTQVDLNFGGVPTISEQEVAKFDINVTGAGISTEIGNFQGTPAGLADKIDESLDRFKETVFELNGSPLYSGSSAMVLIGTEFLKGYADMLRLGQNSAIIQNSLKAAAQTGEFEIALSNLANSFKNGLRQGLNPLIAMSPFDSRTPNLNLAALASGQEGLRILEAVGTAKVLAELTHLGGVRIKSALQAIRNDFSENVEDLVSRIRLQFGEEGAVRISRPLSQRINKLSLKEAAEALEKNLVTPDQALTYSNIRKGSLINEEYLATRSNVQKPWGDLLDVKETAVSGSFANLDNDPLVRVFVSGQSDPTGKGVWMTRKSAIQGKSAAEIKKLLSLPSEPTDVVDVVFDSTDTVFIRDGIAGPNAFGPGGGKQYEIVSELKDSWFENPRKLENL